MQKNKLITELLATADWINQKNWSPATGGNFSARLDRDHFLITASGIDKSQLKYDDFLTANLQGNILDSSLPASAELPVHNLLYQLDKNTGAVLHTHSVCTTVFSKVLNENSWPITGYEMQKAITGFSSHTQTLHLPIFENTQNMNELVEAVKMHYQKQTMPYGFLVKGHGLYTWGENLLTTRRHLEGLEFLIQCELKMLQLASNSTPEQA